MAISQMHILALSGSSGRILGPSTEINFSNKHAFLKPDTFVGDNKVQSFWNLQMQCFSLKVCVQLCPTFDGCQDYAGVVVGDDVGVAVLGFVDLQVGMLPGELLTRIDGLWKEKTE